MNLHGQVRRRGSEAGYAMAALLVALGVMAVMATVVMPVWRQTMQREKEEELIFRGQQYARAIGLFQRKYANAFPPNLDLLVEQRFLRRKFKDPITNDDFAPLTQAQATTPGAGAATAARPGETPLASAGATTTVSTGRGATPGVAGAPGSGPSGGIVGVASKSKDKSIRIYNGRTHYNEWAFVYTPQVQAPGVGAPGVGPGGQRGGQRGQQPGASPFPPGGGPIGPGRGRGNEGGGRGGPFGNGVGPGRQSTPFPPVQPITPGGGGPGRGRGD